MPSLFQQSHRARTVCQGLSQAPKSSTFVEPYVCCRAHSHSHRTSIALSPKSLVIPHCTQGTQVPRGKVTSPGPLGYVAEGLIQGVTGHSPQAPHRLTYHHCSRCPCRASGSPLHNYLQKSRRGFDLLKSFRVYWAVCCVSRCTAGLCDPSQPGPTRCC